VVDRAKALDFLQGGGGERRFAIEGVKDDALEEIAEGEPEGAGEGLEEKEHALLHAHAGLDPLDFPHRRSGRTKTARASGDWVMAATS
jgi:hypothetical protein